MQNYDIVYCGSDYIVSSLVSSITSILKNVKVKNTINFHILDFEIAKPKKDKIISVVDRYNNRYDYAQWGTDEQDKQFNVFFHKPILGRSNKEKLEFYKRAIIILCFRTSFICINYFCKIFSLIWIRACF